MENNGLVFIVKSSSGVWADICCDLFCGNRFLAQRVLETSSRVYFICKGQFDHALHLSEFTLAIRFPGMNPESVQKHVGAHELTRR